MVILDRMRLPKLVRILTGAESSFDSKLYGEAAETYHKLHQVELCTPGLGDIRGLSLALTSLNYARSSHKKTKVHAEIYLLLAIRLRVSWPRLPKYFQRKALSKAAAIAAQTEIGSEMFWLLSKEGRQFFLSTPWTLSDIKPQPGMGLTSPHLTLNPVSQLVMFYQGWMLQSALDILVCPTAGSKVGDVLPILDLVKHSNQLVGSLKGDRLDNVSDWWTSLLSCSALWDLNMMEEAEQTYPDIDSLPLLYQECDNPAYVALLAAHTTHRLVLAGEVTKVDHMIERGSDYLQDAIRFMSQNGNMEDSTLKNILILSMDWHLGSRKILWETNLESTETNYREKDLQGFQSDLQILKKLSQVAPWLQNRLCLHEATLRLMAGAPPAKTQLLLDRAGTDTGTPVGRGLVCGLDQGVYNGEREQAVALLMACRYLPSNLLPSNGERAGMLTEAARLLDKLGYKRQLEECNSMIKTMSSM